MSPDDMQRLMQFLLNQQAQFDANLQKLDANLERLSGRTDRIAEGVLGLTGIVGQLAASQQRTDEHLRELRDQIRETDSHLSIVVDMFERHLREDHGRPPA